MGLRPVVEMQFDRNKLIEIIGQTGADAHGAPAHNMLDVEDRVLGANHQQFGAALCEKWKFPKSFCSVTGFHHKPLDLPANSRILACLVYVADRLVADQRPGFRLDFLSTDIDPAVLDELKLGPDKLADVRNRLPEQLKTVGDLLS